MLYQNIQIRPLDFFQLKQQSFTEKAKYNNSTNKKWISNRKKKNK